MKTFDTDLTKCLNYLMNSTNDGCARNIIPVESQSDILSGFFYYQL